jgi:4-aminobutyrate aminotransferase-like enzyme/Ser/Thr protein kinase RdoA (MazF antagonist)
MMTSVAQGKPDFTIADAEAFAHEYYALEGVGSPMPSERDQNFRIRAGGEGSYVLKISNAGEDLGLLDLQNQVLGILSSHLSEAAVPTLIRGVKDDEIHTISREDGVYPLRLFGYLPGTPLAEFRPHSGVLLERIGRLMGEVDAALAGYSHPAAERSLHWDVANAAEVIHAGVQYIGDDSRRDLVQSFLTKWEEVYAPLLPDLRRQIIHNDGNDYNILVQARLSPPDIKVGLLDFGDLVYTFVLSEAAIAAAYAMFGKPDPLDAALKVLRGYHQQFPLQELESELFFPFALARLYMSVSNAAYQQHIDPANPYLAISEYSAWETLERLHAIPERFACSLARDACGFRPRPETAALVDWLEGKAGTFSHIVDFDLSLDPVLLLDLSVGGRHLGESDVRKDPERMMRHIKGCAADSDKSIAIGKYDEVRGIYHEPAFCFESNDGPDWRSLHLGVDLFLEEGSPVYAPIAGRVAGHKCEGESGGYGSVLLLEHEIGQSGALFYTLYGHLGSDVLDVHAAGDVLDSGDLIGHVGRVDENGGWPPHLHFQIVADHLGRGPAFPGVARADQREIWTDLSPDPNLILGVPGGISAEREGDLQETLERRHRYLSEALSLSYQNPLKVMMGDGQFLFDHHGRAYLDAVNNVPHVGHSHPEVVRAGMRQMRSLTTNTRYLHDNILEYAGRLTEKLPGELQVCFFVNSGSEANDLALRLAMTYTGSDEWIVIENAYHGNLSSLIRISPYKFNGPGGQGAPRNTHTVPMPDGYRGEYKHNDPGAGEKYARWVGQIVKTLVAEGKKPGAFIAEPVMGVGGQIEPPAGYLAEAFKQVRDAGGVCIADEVQIGFGRMGTHFWGFETQGVIPDIVTLGKPIGNGHPLGAVVTTPEIAASFVTGMEYFNTFGGNPVSCAIGLAVLDVIEKEGLQDNAQHVGGFLKQGLLRMKEEHRLIGDVRGRGLFLGVEFILDHGSLTPAGDHATYIVERMKERGVLLSTDGPYHNVIKMKPPMVFTIEDARFLLDTMESVLDETPVQIT